MNQKTKQLLFLLAFVLTWPPGFAQTYTNREWVTTSPTGSDDIHHTSTIVVSGYLYITGNKINGSGNTDIYTLKINATTGDTVWSTAYNGTATNSMDYGVELAHESGNIWVVGAAQNSGTGYDIVTLKYNATSGSLSYSNVFDGSAGGEDVPTDMIARNGVFVCGGSEATNGLSDMVVFSIVEPGGVAWSSYYDYADLHDCATAISSSSSNVVVTGGSAAAVGDWDLATLTIDKSTGLTASSRTDITGATMVEAKAMTTDLQNNIYITGYAVVSGEKNIQTIKLDSNLALVYISEYTAGSNNDCGHDIAVDASGNAYVVGYNELDSGGKNFITIKYNNTGTEQWVTEIGNTTALQEAIAEQVEVAANGNIFLTGTVETGGQTTIDLARYNPDGKLTLHKSLESDTVNYRAFNLTLSGDDIYISGLSHTSPTGSLTVAKYSVFDRNQPIAYTDTIPAYVDDMVLIRFNPDDLILNAVDDPNIRWGYVGDFLDSTAVEVISDSVGFDLKKQRCYKIYPNFRSTDTAAVGRFGDTLQLPPFYSTFGLILPDDKDDSTAIVNFNSAVPHVVVTGHNIYISQTATANDTYYTGGHFGGLAPTTSYPDANINIQRAWDFETGVSSVVVGVYDGGLNYAHDDWSDGTFAGSSVTDGYDYANDIPLTSSADPDNNGHGTAIGGLIGAWRNNSYGIAGIAGGNGSGGVSLHDMKYYDIGNDQPLPCDSLKYGLTLEEIMVAIIEGASGSGHITTPQDIQNHSWMMNHPPNAFIREAFITAYHLGVVICCSSGNNAVGSYCSAQVFPGNYPDHMIIQAGANDENGAKASFSNCPPNLDLIAPGVHELYIALGHQGNDFVDYTQYCYEGWYADYLDGTSLAVPQVAGVAGLMLSYYANNSGSMPNDFAMEDCEYLMERNATDLTASPNYPGPDLETGWGRLNAGATFDSLWFPKYIVEHHTMPVNTSGATLVGYHESTCLEQGTFGLSAGTVIYVNRYSVTATGSHTQPSGYNLVDAWAVGSKSQDMIGIASTSTVSSVNCALAGNAYFIPAEQNPTLNSFSTTSASMTGYIYEILDFSYNHLGWWPVGPSADVTLSYTLYWENPLLNGVTQENKTAFSIYPNPTNSTCTILFDGTMTGLSDIILLDVTGQLVKTIATSDNLSTGNSVIFDVSGLSQGVYFVAVRTEEKNLIEKLIIGQ